MREPELLEYLPGYLRGYRELVEVLVAEEPELRELWQGVERAQDNLFILTADSLGLRRFERLLGISPGPGDSLESRRDHVLVRWNSTTPYTLRYLLSRLDDLCGPDGYTLTPYWDEYRFTLEVHLPRHGTVDDLHYLLDHVIPMNLEWKAHNSLPQDMAVTAHIGGAMCATTVYAADIDNIHTAEETAELYVGCALTGTAYHQDI